MRTTALLLTLLFAFTTLSALAGDQPKPAPPQNDGAIAAVLGPADSLGIIPAGPDGFTLDTSSDA